MFLLGSCLARIQVGKEMSLFPPGWKVLHFKVVWPQTSPARMQKAASKETAFTQTASGASLN